MLAHTRGRFRGPVLRSVLEVGLEVVTGQRQVEMLQKESTASDGNPQPPFYPGPWETMINH